MNTKVTSSLMATTGVAMVLSLFAVLPAFAASTTVQSFATPVLNGYESQIPNNNSYGPATMALSGNIQTNGNGELNLSPLKGNVTFNGATYDVQVKPNGKVATQSYNNGCYSSTSNVQIGNAKLNGNDGRAIFGLALIQWGTAQYNCYGWNYSYQFTSATIITQDNTGTVYSISGYANALPTIQ